MVKLCRGHVVSRGHVAVCPGFGFFPCAMSSVVLYSVYVPRRKIHVLGYALMRIVIGPIVVVRVLSPN